MSCNCNSCAQCNMKFGFSERNIVAFSNGKCTHPGDCTREYQKRQAKNKSLKIVSFDARASQGFVVVEPVFDQVGASG